ncbi:hypothetical protein Tco_0199143 [Tanacetum coccineum]
MNLAIEFENVRIAKDDMRKTYEECNDIPEEKRALIDIYLKEESNKDYEMYNLSTTCVQPRDLSWICRAKKLGSQHLALQKLLSTLSLSLSAIHRGVYLAAIARVSERITLFFDFFDGRLTGAKRSHKPPALILSARQRVSKAEIVTGAVQDETLKWNDRPLLKLKTKLGTRLLDARTMAEASEIQSKADEGKIILSEPEIISLQDIKPTHTKKTIEVRVYRKWIARNVKTKDPSNFCCILLEKEQLSPASVQRHIASSQIAMTSSMLLKSKTPDTYRMHSSNSKIQEFIIHSDLFNNSGVLRMTINLRRCRWRVKVPSKFNETDCALKDRKNDQQVLPEDELECDKSNDDKEIGENSRVCGSDDDVSSRRKVNNDDDERMNEETVILKEKMQSNNSINHSTTKNNVSSSPNQVNVQDETIKTWYGSGDNASYDDKVIQSATNDNKLEHIPTVNENG